MDLGLERGSGFGLQIITCQKLVYQSLESRKVSCISHPNSTSTTPKWALLLPKRVKSIASTKWKHPTFQPRPGEFKIPSRYPLGWPTRLLFDPLYWDLIIGWKIRLMCYHDDSSCAIFFYFSCRSYSQILTWLMMPCPVNPCLYETQNHHSPLWELASSLLLLFRVLMHAGIFFFLCRFAAL